MRTKTTTRLTISVPGHTCLRCGEPAADFEWPLTINKRTPEYCVPCGRMMVETICSRADVDPTAWLRGLPHLPDNQGE